MFDPILADPPTETRTRRELYDAYMASDAWQALRSELFRKQGRRCAACRRTPRDDFVDAHHLIYRDPVESGTVIDLMPLCRRCHDIVHDKMPPFAHDVPTGRRFTCTLIFLRARLGLDDNGKLSRHAKHLAREAALDPNRETNKMRKARVKAERAAAKSVAKEARRLIYERHQQGVRDRRRRDQIARELARAANVNPMVFDNHSLETLERQLALVTAIRARSHRT